MVRRITTGSKPVLGSRSSQLDGRAPVPLGSFASGLATRFEAERALEVVRKRACEFDPHSLRSWPGRLLVGPLIFTQQNRVRFPVGLLMLPRIVYRVGAPSGCRKVWNSAWPGTTKSAVRIRPARRNARCPTRRGSGTANPDAVSSILTGSTMVAGRKWRAARL